MVRFTKLAILALVVVTAYAYAPASRLVAVETGASLSSIGPLTFAPDGTLDAAEPARRRRGSQRPAQLDHEARVRQRARVGGRLVERRVRLEALFGGLSVPQGRHRDERRDLPREPSAARDGLTGLRAGAVHD